MAKAKELDSSAADSSESQRSGVKETADFQQTASDTKALLDAQPKVRILVPLEQGEAEGSLLPVNINGYRLNVPKNVYVDVPQTVADIISESLNIYSNNSASKMRLDGSNKDKEQALS